MDDKTHLYIFNAEILILINSGILTCIAFLSYNIALSECICSLDEYGCTKACSDRTIWDIAAYE